jgi:hypothetical protein
MLGRYCGPFQSLRARRGNVVDRHPVSGRIDDNSIQPDRNKLAASDPFSDRDHGGPQEKEKAKVSQILHGLTVGQPDERLTVADLQREFGDRAFGLLLLLFALPNCIPIPGIPGLSTITGLPVVFFALQLALGREYPYLPAWLRGQSFTRGQLAHLIVKAGPKLRWVEAMIRPRIAMAVNGAGERLLGIIVLVLAITLSLPIPLGNLLPAIALALLSLALVERDGLLVLVGYAASAIAGGWLLVLYLGAEELVRQIFHWA